MLIEQGRRVDYKSIYSTTHKFNYVCIWKKGLKSKHSWMILIIFGVFLFCVWVFFTALKIYPIMGKNNFKTSVLLNALLGEYSWSSHLEQSLYFINSLAFFFDLISIPSGIFTKEMRKNHKDHFTKIYYDMIYNSDIL